MWNICGFCSAGDGANAAAPVADSVKTEEKKETNDTAKSVVSKPVEKAEISKCVQQFFIFQLFVISILGYVFVKLSMFKFIFKNRTYESPEHVSDILVQV